MDLKQFLDTLAPAEREDYAKRAGTTVAYLAQLTGGHRSPSPSLSKRLVAASNNKIKLAKLRPDIWSKVA
jgi:predicted transcriptional regulator